MHVVWFALDCSALRCLEKKKRTHRSTETRTKWCPYTPMFFYRMETSDGVFKHYWYIYILIICTFLYVWIHIRTSSYTSLNSVYILRIKNSHCQWYLCHVCILAPNTFPCWPQQSDWSNSKEHKRIQMNHKTTFHIERFFRLLKLSLCNCGRMAFAAKSRSFLIQGRKCGCCFLQEGADRAIQRVLHHWMKGIIWNHGNHASVECPRPKSS